MNNIKDHISFSQVMSYVECPEDWLFRYVLGIKSPPGKARIRGTAVHKSLADHYINKRIDGKGFKIDTLQDVYRQEIDESMKTYMVEIEKTKTALSDEYLEREATLSVAEVVDTGASGLREYYSEIEPHVEPDLVEEKFELFTNIYDMTITGFMDVTTISRVIHETKTTGKYVSDELNIARDLQLAIYFIAYPELRNKKPKALRKDFIIFGKKNTKVKSFEITKPYYSEEDVLRYIYNVVKAIEANAFYCIHRDDDWRCTPAYCGYMNLHAELREHGFEWMKDKYFK